MTIRSLYPILEPLIQSVTDPVLHDYLTEAVRLFPCGHHVNEDIAKLIMGKRKVCPVDHQLIEKYEPDYKLREIARQIALLTPALNEQPPLERPLIRTTPTPVPVPIEVDIAHNLSPLELKKIPTSEFKKRLRDEPDNGKLYRNFAKTLEPEETVSLNKKTFTRELLCKTAIELDEQDSLAYCYLADILVEEKKSEIKLKEKFCTVRELYQEALLLDPNNGEACVHVGRLLQEGEKVPVLGLDEELGQQELYLRAIQNHPQLSIAYAALGASFQEGSHINGLDEALQSKKALYIKAIELALEESRYYIDLANHLKEGEEISIDEKLFTREKLYLKAIELGAQESELYFKLAQILPKEGMIYKGKLFTQKGLYQKAIEQDNRYPEAFFHLASLANLKEFFLIAGKQHSKAQLLYKAIKRGFVESRGYVMLADLLQKDKTDSLPESIKKKELYLEAVRRNPNDSAAYVGVGSCLEAGEKEVLLKNRSSLELYQKAIKINPKEPRAYVAIGKTLGEKGKFEINKKKYSREELYQLAIDLDPSYADPYLELALQLDGEKTIDLKEGEFNKQTLLQRTLECNPDQPSVYLQLAQMIPNDKTVTIGEKPFSKKELYIEAIELGACHSQPYFDLAEILTHDEQVTVSGQVFKQKGLYLKVVLLNRHKSSAYRRLAHLLEEGETVTVRGKELNQDHLERAAEAVHLMEQYIQGVERAVDKKEAYLKLADKIDQEDPVELVNGEKIDKKGLYLKCIDIDPRDGKLYIEAAAFLKKEKSLTLLNNKSMTKEDLYYTGMKLLPETIENYHWIASKLAPSEELTKTIEGKLPEIVTISRKELYVKAIEIDPNDADSYCYLAAEINQEKIKIGRDKMPKKDLYAKAITLIPKKSHPHLELVLLNINNKTHKVGDETFSKRELCLRALEHIRNNNLQDQEKEAQAYYYLASTLEKKGEEISIEGEQFSKEKLYCKVLELNKDYGDVYERLLEIKPNLNFVTLMSGEVLSRQDIGQRRERTPKRRDSLPGKK